MAASEMVDWLGGVGLGILKMEAVGLAEIFGADGKQVGALNQVQASSGSRPVFTVSKWASSSGKASRSGRARRPS
jgi:hypothetical protein